MVYKDIRSPDFTGPVQLAAYNGEEGVPVTMLWTEGKEDLGGGFRQVRALKDINHTLDGLLGNVKDGTIVGIFPSGPAQGDNAIWKFAPVNV
ncbi:hypothetical protein ACP70R_007574 [Stipagrostis hirtigluma subsp. patula]